MTGYDLAKAFHSSVGYVWHAPNSSQIYPELRKMEGDRLIVGETATWGTRGTKTRYEVTPAGIQAFREWMATPMEYSTNETLPTGEKPGVLRVDRSDYRAHSTACPSSPLRRAPSSVARASESIRRREHPIVKRPTRDLPGKRMDKDHGVRRRVRVRRTHRAGGSADRMGRTRNHSRRRTERSEEAASLTGCDGRPEGRHSGKAIVLSRDVSCSRSSTVSALCSSCSAVRAATCAASK